MNGDFDKLSVDLNRARNRALDVVDVVVRKTALDVERTAKSIVPVDTGFLRSSISHEVRRTAASVTGEIGPTAEYGEYVETGTARQAPQAYMGPALDRHGPAFEEAIAQAVDRLL